MISFPVYTNSLLAALNARSHIRRRLRGSSDMTAPASIPLNIMYRPNGSGVNATSSDSDLPPNDGIQVEVFTIQKCDENTCDPSKVIYWSAVHPRCPSKDHWHEPFRSNEKLMANYCMSRRSPTRKRQVWLTCVTLSQFEHLLCALPCFIYVFVVYSTYELSPSSEEMC